MSTSRVVLAPVVTGLVKKVRVGDMRDLMEAIDGVATDREWLLVYPDSIQYDRLEDGS